MLSKASRLSRAEAEALKNGKSVFMTLLSLRWILANRTQISVSIPKKVANSAVDRNRIRRRVYSALEQVILDINRPVKIMIFPKTVFRTLPHHEIVKEIKNAFLKAGIIS